MNVAVTPLEAKHLETAATLLAGRHRRDRERDPRLPQAFEDPARCRELVERAASSDGAAGVLAEVHGEPAGFAVMTPQLVAETHFLAQFFPPRGASLSLGAHAAREGAEYDVYREMYATLADEFVRRGFFEHMISVPAKDAAAIEAFVSLGFGITSACAVRGVEPVERAAASIDVHQAGAEDLAVIAALRDELTLHHTRSPIFSPWLTEADEAARTIIEGLLQDPEANAHWVGYRDGKALGMNTFMPPSFLAPLELPDNTIYLFLGVVTEEARMGGVGSAILARGVDWAREQGYAHIALHFATPNLSGAQFWQSSGFVPVEYGMRRTIDPRIAWARA